MFDERDIREILIHNVNRLFRFNGVESLLAYQIAIYIILDTKPETLIKEKALFITFDSARDLAQRISKWSFSKKIPSKSSMSTAFKYLDKAMVAYFQQDYYDAEEQEVFELEKSRYLLCMFFLKKLRGNTSKFRYNKDNHEYFETHIMIQFDKLNSIVAYNPIPLLAYQIGMRLVMEANIDDFNDPFYLEYKNNEKDEEGFEEKEVASLVNGFLTYKKAAEYFSYFNFDKASNLALSSLDKDIGYMHRLGYLEKHNLAVSSISDNLDRLHNLGFLRLEWLQPSELDIYTKINKPVLFIVVYLDIPDA